MGLGRKGWEVGGGGEEKIVFRTVYPRSCWPCHQQQAEPGPAAPPSRCPRRRRGCRRACGGGRRWRSVPSPSPRPPLARSGCPSWGSRRPAPQGPSPGHTAQRVHGSQWVTAVHARHSTARARVTAGPGSAVSCMNSYDLFWPVHAMCCLA